MKRAELNKASLNPNFIGSWIIEPTLCEEMISYFENNKHKQSQGSTSEGLNIETKNSLSFVSIKVGTATLFAIVMQTLHNSPHLKIGNPIQVIFKATEVIISTGLVDHISLQNRLAGKIYTIESGLLMSRLLLKTEIGMLISVIPTISVNRLELKVDSEITAMIKSNNLMLIK